MKNSINTPSDPNTRKPQSDQKPPPSKVDVVKEDVKSKVHNVINKK